MGAQNQLVIKLYFDLCSEWLNQVFGLSYENPTMTASYIYLKTQVQLKQPFSNSGVIGGVMEVLATKGQGHIFERIDNFTGPGFLFFQICFLFVVTL